MATALNFYDLKKKKSFTTSTYSFVNKSGRRFAVATTPSGSKAYRIVSNK